jgi:hypothetical protein
MVVGDRSGRRRVGQEGWSVGLGLTGNSRHTIFPLRIMTHVPSDATFQKFNTSNGDIAKPFKQLLVHPSCMRSA